MKIYILSALIIFSVLGVEGQIKKVYGYIQDTQGGMVEDNNRANKKYDNDAPTRYFLYSETEKHKKITFLQVWIKGNLYSFKLDTVTKIPVVIETSNGGELILRDTLIKYSTNEIIQLKNLVKSFNAVIPSNIKKLVAANNVVIVYTYRGKTSTCSLRKFSMITPLFTQ